jgi:hypothetical protein
MIENNSKHFLPLTIDGKQYKWHHQYITGNEVRNLGNISKEDKVFLAIKQPWADEPIFDDARIDLARPGIEHFYSKKQDDHHVVIIVNGRQRNWDERTISYEQVARLAFENYVENDSTIYTVTYTDGPGQNQEGSIVKGDKVYVKNEMKFNVTATNRS